MIQARIDDGVGVITLDDAAHRNALTPALSLALADGVGDLLGRGARALVLTAAPPVFCAGGSLDELEKGPALDLDAAYAGPAALAAAPVPTLAAVDGPCLGAGVNLPLACDVILATPRAVFDTRWLDVGIHPGGAHLWRLEQRVGRQTAAAMVLFGATLKGEQAVARGLAFACVASDDLMREAAALAGRAARRDPELVWRTKATLAANDSVSGPAEAHELERAAQLWSLSREGFAEHVKAVRARLAARG
ncbi:enoyl-CoA hydratase-related protein [Yinghuangia sp. YIM S09857]|uniref:enoyl-CoA hydratase-related protein n=1 Tax=Yinghuangia sp. YIM S09857 TaxID=3436929 RepID=UPI003F52EE7D